METDAGTTGARRKGWLNGYWYRVQLSSRLVLPRRRIPPTDTSSGRAGAVTNRDLHGNGSGCDSPHSEYSSHYHILSCRLHTQIRLDRSAFGTNVLPTV